MLRKFLILSFVVHFGMCQSINLSRNTFSSAPDQFPSSLNPPIPYNNQIVEKTYQKQNAQQTFQYQQQFSNAQSGSKVNYQNQQQSQSNNQGNNGNENVGYHTYQDVGTDPYSYNSQQTTTQKTSSYNYETQSTSAVYSSSDNPWNNRLTSTEAPYASYDQVSNQNYGQIADQESAYYPDSKNEDNKRYQAYPNGDNSNVNSNRNSNNNYNNNRNDEVGLSGNSDSLKPALQHIPDEDRILAPNRQPMIELIFPPTLSYDEDDTEEATTRASFLAYIKSKHRTSTTERHQN